MLDLPSMRGPTKYQDFYPTVSLDINIFLDEIEYNYCIVQKDI
jgi:hypothetical protein